MAEDEALVERVAKALYDQKVKQARSELEAVVFEHKDLVELVKKLRTESETAQILIFYSYLDDRIRDLISRQMINLDSNSANEAMFGSNGPLGSFSNRNRLAYHLGWLTSQTWAKLEAFRKVRNEFAHRAFKVSMSDPVIADKLKIIDYDMKGKLREIVPAEHQGHLNDVLPRLVMLAHWTFVELLVWPIAKTHNVHPEHVMHGYDDQPQNMRALGLSASEAILIAAAVPGDLHR